MNEDDTPKKSKCKFLGETTSIVFIWIGLSVIILALVAFIVNESFFIPNSLIKADKFGQLGDFVGGIAGAFWALAGVILFYVALKKQKESLALQITEFELQRNELKNNRLVLEKQSENQLLIQYETTYYNLLNLFQRVVSEFLIQTTSKETIKSSYYEESTQTRHPEQYQHIHQTYRGKECLKLIFKQINFIKKFKKNTPEYSLENILNDTYKDNEIHLKPYFNLITQILIKIDNCPNDNKASYADILYATFTDEENALITVFRDGYFIDKRLNELLNEYFPNSFITTLPNH